MCSGASQASQHRSCNILCGRNGPVIWRSSRAHAGPVTDWAKSRIMRVSQPTQSLDPRKPGAIRIHNAAATGSAYVDPVPTKFAGTCLRGPAIRPASHYSTVSPVHKNKLAAARGRRADTLAARVDQADRVRRIRLPVFVVVLWIGWLIQTWRASAADALTCVARVRRVLPSSMQSEVAATATSDSLSHPSPSLDLSLCRLCPFLCNRCLRCR